MPRFRDTSAAAPVGGDVVGFVIGSLRPRVPDTTVVLQVTVDAGRRGKGAAAALLVAGEFPDEHETEVLYRIGSFRDVCRIIDVTTG